MTSEKAINMIKGVHTALIALLALSVALPARAETETTRKPVQVDPEDEQKEDKGGRLYRALGLMTYGVSAGDLLTTEIALSRGLAEGNPLQRYRAIRIGSHVAFPVLTNHLTDRVRRGGHPKAALWMRIATVAGMGFVIAHNIKVMRGQR